MAMKWTGDLDRIVGSAQRDASKMHVRLNTALLLRSMIKNSGTCRDVLTHIGLSLASVECALQSAAIRPEPLQTPHQIYEKAARLSICANLSEVSSLQVLLAMIDSPCMCQSLLSVMRTDFDHLRALICAQMRDSQQYVGARSPSSVSMNAVAVQRKSPMPSPVTYIEPQPAMCFGAESQPEVVRASVHPPKSRGRLVTPEEIKRMMQSSGSHRVIETRSGSSPALPACNGGNMQRRVAQDKRSDVTPAVSPGSGDIRQSATYRSTSSKEIQQATTLDLARRLMQKKSQTNECSAEIQEKIAQKTETKTAETGAVGAQTQQHAQPSASPAAVSAAAGVSEKTKNAPKRSETPSNQTSAAAAQTAQSASGKSASSEAAANEVIKQTHSAAPAGERSLQTSARSAHAMRPQAWAAKETGHAKKQPAKIAGYSPLALDKIHFPMLAQYGRNLLAEAAAGRIDPVIERDSEINQLIDILNKRRSNNPILVGEAGVGKTAIIEGLAVKMARREAPEALEGKTIIALDYGSILSGTQLRGAIQERIRGIKSEIKKANGKIILFLDEIHSWIAPNNGDPNADASLELKLALSHGEIMCVGTATPQELRRAFNADAGFERRFDFIEVKAPSPETSIRIIERGIIGQYADHHHVTYAAESIRQAVKLSERYIQDRALPDKAISILDRAGSLCERSGEPTVTPEHVARVVAMIAEIPIERLLMTERQKLMKMEQILSERLIGHEKNVTKIANVIRRNHAGFGAHRPIGSFLFLGPTGVGKTEAAKVLADFLFGSSKNMVRFDMSEFMEQHSVAKLIGAPAGYVGFDDGGLLTEALRKRPYQIVLFDEIEKAHPDVWNILLQILDEGRLTDAKGRHADFSNAVIILTSNLGAQDLANAMQGAIGFANKDKGVSEEEAEEIILRTAKSKFSPELWNRIEEKLVFQPLDLEQIERIAHLLLADSARRLQKDKGVRLAFDECALIPFLVNNGGFDPSYGARPMRQTIQSQVESKVAEWIIAHDALPNELFVGIRNDIVYVEEIAPLGIAASQ